MRKTQTLFTVALLVLLGSMGAAQAQIARIALLTQPEPAAREGGKNEKAGTVWLDIDVTGSLEEAVASFTLTYSSPLAAGLMLGTEDINNAALDPDDLGHAGGTIKITPTDTTMTGRTAILVEGVRLDVSQASGPVTVTLSVERAAGGIALLTGPDTRNIIEDILPGVMVEVGVDPGTVRTRGAGTPLPDTIVTLKPGFTGAWNEGGMEGAGMSLEFEVEGLPKGVKAIVGITSFPAQDNIADPNVVGALAMSESTSLTGDADGNPKSLIITLGDTGAGMDLESVPTSVILTLMLDTSNEDVQLPLQEGEIRARVTIADIGDAATDYFINKFTSYMIIFNIRPAQCELLYPVVSVLPNFGNWDTAISVTNPAYTAEKAAGGLTFTFYGIGGVEATYDTTMDGVTGRGLEADGTLSPGSTYQVMVSEILKLTDWGEEFIGHAHLRADYTNCTGLGWVTDFMGVNQAYTATVIDADTGSDNQ